MSEYDELPKISKWLLKLLCSHQDYYEIVVEGTPESKKASHPITEFNLSVKKKICGRCKKELRRYD